MGLVMAVGVCWVGVWAFLVVPSHNASCWGCQTASPLPRHMSIQPPALCECRHLCYPLPPRHEETCELLQTAHPGKEEQHGKNKLRTLSVPRLKRCSLLIRCEPAGLHGAPKTDMEAAFSLCQGSICVPANLHTVCPQPSTCPPCLRARAQPGTIGPTALPFHPCCLCPLFPTVHREQPGSSPLLPARLFVGDRPVVQPAQGRRVRDQGQQSRLWMCKGKEHFSTGLALSRLLALFKSCYTILLWLSNTNINDVCVYVSYLPLQCNSRWLWLEKAPHPQIKCES